MNTGSAAALAVLADTLPACDALNLGYALLVEGELPAAMERAIDDVLRADPLIDGPWLWHQGRAEREQFAALAAAHLSMPLASAQPFSAALWSASGTSHLFLVAVHHVVADGIVLDRLAHDLSRRLQGHAVDPIWFAPQRSLPAPAACDAPRLPLPPGAPSMRASCRTTRLSAELADQFRETTRRWRTTPFAGAVASVAAAVAAWTGQTEVGVTSQFAARNSNAALRAPGPWYDYSNHCFHVAAGEPLRVLLLEVSERLARSLGIAGLWTAGRDEPCPEVLVVYDRHPLSSLKIPGCHVTPLSVERHPRRADGAHEYLVATEADIVVFFREQSGSIGLSLFTKMARVPEATAQWLLDALVDAIRALCDEGQLALDRAELPTVDPPAKASPVVWPEPALSDEPLVDAVSPVFRVRPDTLDAFARDARCTLDEWGTPPWHRMS